MEDELVFADEDEVIEEVSTQGSFKVLIVDDDKEVHSFTKLALHDFEYMGRGVVFISAFDGAEAREVLYDIEDIAVIFLDVVMETNVSGLEVAKFIRQELKNEMIRIIIRTGQPGEAPERYVIDHYDINDYKEKTELTADKLYTTLRTALAQYTQLQDVLNKKNELYHLLITDKLTSLPNRVKLNYDIDTVLHKTLMLINIDRFSLLNDAYGFAVGDKVLLHVADLLRKILKPGMTLYRLEADVYAITISDTTIEVLESEVDTIRAVLDNTPLEIDDLSLYVHVTIGIVYYEVGNIIQKAEIALRQARRVSRNRVEYYSDSLEMHNVIEENNSWTGRIAKALEDDKILAYYQPIIECSTGKIVKYEALVRLEHEGEIYSPFHFLNTARYAGYLHKITCKMFEKACRKFQDNDLEFSINITDQDLGEAKFIDYLERVRKKYGIARERIIFELLEETSLSDNALATENLHKICDLGYGLSVDDFGTQCSNFAQLGTYDFESLKIDGKFIKDIDVNEQSQIITESILFFTNKIGFNTVAEFVHSKEIFDIVKELGVTYAQGYYFGEPKPDLIVQ